MSKSNFWDREAMNVLMSEFKSMHDVDKKAKSIEIKPTADKKRRAYLYQEIYLKHRQMAEVVAPHARGSDFDTRCEACVARLYEVMMFYWNPKKNLNSYGYFYRSAYSYVMDWLSGKIDGSQDLYSKRYTQSRTIQVAFDDLPKGETIHEYAEWLATQSQWDKFKVTKNKNHWSIKYSKKYNPFLSIQGYNDPLQVPDIKNSRHELLEEQIDWQILSEYIPDVPCNEINKQTAYIFIESLEEILDMENLSLSQNSLYVLLYEKIQSQMPIVISKSRLYQVKLILRQAFQYYAEDFIDNDPQMDGEFHGLSFDHRRVI